jgi:hypothetical protein
MPVREVQFCEAAHAKFIICVQTIDEGGSQHEGFFCCSNFIRLTGLVSDKTITKA